MPICGDQLSWAQNRTGLPLHAAPWALAHVAASRCLSRAGQAGQAGLSSPPPPPRAEEKPEDSSSKFKAFQGKGLRLQG